VIKMVMAMRDGVLPKSLHVQEPSRQVDWSSGAVALLRENVAWPERDKPRMAAVSSFGVSGTNAHVILEQGTGPESRAEPAPGLDGHEKETASIGEPPSAEDAGSNQRSVWADGVLGKGFVPWVVSAKDSVGLAAHLAQLRQRVQADQSLRPADVAFSLAHRPQLDHRAVVVGAERDSLLEGLNVLDKGDSVSGAVIGRARGSGPAPVVFVFPGQGAQWEGMACELMESSPVFAASMELCGKALAPFVDWSLEDVVRGRAGRPDLDRLDVIQPVLFATMVSLAALWRACGVHPAAVVGHSQGEIAAAHVAGGLSLEDAARIVALRSRMLASLEARGQMASIWLGAQELAPRLKRLDGRVVIAAINGPSWTVVSGEEEALRELLGECADEGIRAREVPGATRAGHSPQIEEIREQLLSACSSIVPRPGEIPFYSTVTGNMIDTGELDGEYWYRNAREPVQFDATVRAQLARGFESFLEVSTHPVLTVAIEGILEDALADASSAIVSGTLRRGEGGPERFLTSLAECWTNGLEVDWKALFDSGATRVTLPRYPFQRTRYWIDPGGATVGDMALAGQRSADHPLLGATVTLADNGGWLLTGCLSLQTHPWLADHAAIGMALLPGTAFVELALRAATLADCETVSELTLRAPLVLPEHGSVQVQVSLGGLDDEGRCSIAIYSRPEENFEDDSTDGGDWTLNAQGTLAQRATQPDDWLAQEPTELNGGAWSPPADAQSLAIEELYDRAAERGLEYGPAFQGLRAAWRRGADLFAEVVLPAEQESDAGRFGLHPALLDGALHALGAEVLSGVEEEEAAHDQLWLPFAWTDVCLYAPGASALYVRLISRENGVVSLIAFDREGAPVVSVGSLLVRPVSASALGAARVGYHRSLFSASWTPIGLTQEPVSKHWAILGRPESASVEGLRSSGVSVESHPDLASLVSVLDAGGAMPEVVLVDWVSDPARTEEGESSPEAQDRECAKPSRGMVDSVHSAVGQVLELAHAWIGDQRFAQARLVLATRGAVAVREDEDVPDLAAAAAWGLLRSAQSEHPRRFVLADLDGEQACWASLPAALAHDEPQLACRDGVFGALRLARVARTAVAGAQGEVPPQSSSACSAQDDDRGRSLGALALDSRDTVLITGGTGNLGSLVARRLVSVHGARNLLLVSRGGAGAAGSSQLEADLAALGAETRVVSCDVTDREQLQALLEAIPPERPLRVIVHAAAVLEDGVIDSLDRAQLDRVLTPKVDAAWYLHELTEDLELSAFVLFSSAAGTFGNPGQGNYAAANTFLDALAAYRRARGMSGISLAWGLWQQIGGTSTDELSEIDRSRMARSGFAALTYEEGLELLDTALSLNRALALPVKLDAGALRARARSGTLPALLRGLVRAASTRSSTGELGESLALRLKAMPQQEHGEAVLAIVRKEVATVLGHSHPGAIELQASFKDLGFDSLTAVELRNRLVAITGIDLPITIIFDHPSTKALAEHLLHEALPQVDRADDRDPKEADIRAALATIPLTRLREAGLMDALLALTRSDYEAPLSEERDAADMIDALDVESLMRMTLDGADVVPRVEADEVDEVESLSNSPHVEESEVRN
jgi:polyketide synthase 12